MNGLKFVVFGMLLCISGCILRLTVFFVAANGARPDTISVTYSIVAIGIGLVAAVHGLFRHD